MRALLLALVGALMFAEGNPAAGTWKLNASLSRLQGSTPEFVHDGVMQIRPEIYTGQGQPVARSAGQTGPPPVYFMELSPDRQRLTLTQPGTHPGFKAVFDKR